MVVPIKLIMGVRHALITPQSYTGMDTTSLYTSSGTLFVTYSLSPRHVELNHVPLFGVDTIERRLT